MSLMLALALALLPAAGAVDIEPARRQAQERMRRADFRGAIAALQAALEQARRERDMKSVQALSNMIGELYHGVLFDFPQAFEFYNESRAAAHALGDRKTEADLTCKLGSLTAVFGDYAKGAKLCDEAAALAPDEAARKGYRETSATFRSRLDEAQGLEPKTAKPKRDSAAEYRGPSTAAPAGYQADELLKSGRPEAARAIYARLGDRAGVGRCLLAEKDYRGADAEFAAHNARYEDPQSRLDWRHWRLPDYYGRAQALEGLGDYPRAAAFYLKVWDAGMKKRSAWKLERNDSYYLFGAEAAEGLVRVCGPEEAFYYAEAGRARILAKSLGARRAAEVPPLVGELERREAEVTTRLTQAQRRLDAAIAGQLDDASERAKKDPGPGRIRIAADPEARDRAQRDLEGPARELEALVPEIRRVRPDYAAAHYPRPLHAADIPLKKDEALLEYAVTETSAKVFVVKGGKVAAVKTIPATRRELARLVRQYRAFFDGVETAQDLARFDASVGRRLAELLLGPVLGDIPKGARVVISPDGPLALLPFEALVLSQTGPAQMPSGRHGPAPSGVRYVGDDYDIAYAPSATSLATQRLLRKHERAPEQLFVLADPVFGPSDPRWKGVTTPSAYKSEVRGAVLKSMGLGGKRGGKSDGKRAAQETGFPRLDKTALLAEALQKRIFGGQGGLVLEGESATEARVKAADLSRYRYLVFATHGILDGSTPYLREPALVLGQQGGTEDGFLTMGEVEKLQINADLVALTACQTGVGRAIRGEGTLGLVRAFQLAGADSVLVSLWNVAEDSTTELAKVFFAGLKEGLAPQAALRRARAEVRRQGYEHPFYWAPFILVGD